MKREPENSAPIKYCPTVLHVICGSDPRGGLPSYVREVSNQPIPGFAQRVWRHRDYAAETDIYVCKGWAPKTDVNVVSDLFGAFLDFVPLYLWLRKNPRVILHAHTRMGIILAVLMRTLRKIPVVIHVHGRWRQKKFHRWLWKRAKAKVIFNSKGSCLYFGCSPENSEILMPTIEWPKRPSPGGGRCIAASLIVRHKNVRLVVEAFNRTRPLENSGLHIYGFSATQGDITYQQEIIAAAHQDPRIQLHDWNSRWTDDLKIQDTFIHASALESFGIVLLEAYSKGCRIVCPRGTFLEDLPMAGVFPADLTVEDVARKIEIAQSFQPPPDYWQNRHSVAPLFSLENAALRLAGIYRSVMPA